MSQEPQTQGYKNRAEGSMSEEKGPCEGEKHEWLFCENSFICSNI